MHLLFDLRKTVLHPKVPGRLGQYTGLEEDFRRELFSIQKNEMEYQGVKQKVLEWLATQESPNRDNQILIGCGCHSGKHRSVSLVERLSKERCWGNVQVSVHHLHLGKYSDAINAGTKRQKERDNKRQSQLDE